MHLVITDPIHQWQGDNDDIISHGRLYDVFTVELAQVSTCKYIDSMRRVWHSMVIKCMCKRQDIYSSSYSLGTRLALDTQRPNNLHKYTGLIKALETLTLTRAENGKNEWYHPWITP